MGRLVIKRRGKRAIVLNDAKLSFWGKTPGAFVASFKGLTQYQSLGTDVQVQITAEELGKLLQAWGVVELIKGTKSGV